jgi:hypothetical protein
VGPNAGLDAGGEDKNSHLLPGLEPPIIQPIAQRYATELSRLLMVRSHFSFHMHFPPQNLSNNSVRTIRVLGYDSRRGLGIFLFTTASRTALGLTQPPIKWVPGSVSLGVKREADHSPPYSAEVKNAWSYTSIPQYVFTALCLVKHRDNFTFTFISVLH